MTIEVTAASFEQTIERGIVLLDFWAAWCAPCRRFAPVYDAASAKHPDIAFGKVDANAESALAAALEITALPTVMAFRDGMLVFAHAGGLPPSALEHLVEQLRVLDMDELRRRAGDEQAAG